MFLFLISLCLTFNLIFSWDISEYFEGEWILRTSRTDLASKEQTFDDYIHHWFLDKDANPDATSTLPKQLIGKWYINETEQNQTVSSYEITIVFSDSLSGTVEYGTDSYEMKALFEFELSNLPNSIDYVSYGKFSYADYSGHYQFIVSEKTFSITIIPSSTSSTSSTSTSTSQNIILWSAQKIPKVAKSGWFGGGKSTFILVGLFILNIFLKKYVTPSEPQAAAPANSKKSK